jgi:sortase (surface protein transpeptidase)
MIPPVVSKVNLFVPGNLAAVVAKVVRELLQSPSAQLTLITCYPTHYVGPAPKRLVVVARLITRFSTAGE